MASKVLAVSDKTGALFVFFALRGRCDFVGSEEACVKECVEMCETRKTRYVVAQVDQSCVVCITTMHKPKLSYQRVLIGSLTAQV